MTHLTRALLLAAVCITPAFAQRVDVADLGSLELAFLTPRAADRYEGPPMAAEVSFRPGEALRVVSPYPVRQIIYLVEPGTEVARDQPVAELSGPEIEHFLTRFRVTGQRLESARRRFENNRELYRKRTIDETRWIEISEAFYTLQLEYEHLRHFRELLETDDRFPGRVTLKSPLDGRFLYEQEDPGIAAGGELALVVPAGALRLRVEVPLQQSRHLVGLHHGNCDLAVTSISGVAAGFFLRAWSAPLTEACDVVPGEHLMVVPVYNRPGFEVPREAILHWRGEPAVLLREGEALVPTPVEIIASSGDDYHVTSTVDLRDRKILTRSVSAVQGILLGLGGE